MNDHGTLAFEEGLSASRTQLISNVNPYWTRALDARELASSEVEVVPTMETISKAQTDTAIEEVVENARTPDPCQLRC